MQLSARIELAASGTVYRERSEPQCLGMMIMVIVVAGGLPRRL